MCGETRRRILRGLCSNSTTPFQPLSSSQAPPGLWNGIKIMTFADGLRSLNLCLWDEQRAKLVTMAQYDAHAAAEKAP